MALRQPLALEETEPVLRSTNGHACPRLFLFEGEPVGARRSYWRAMKRGAIFANIASAAGASVCA
jgi:hypothetical protein